MNEYCTVAFVSVIITIIVYTLTCDISIGFIVRLLGDEKIIKLGREFVKDSLTTEIDFISAASKSLIAGNT